MPASQWKFAAFATKGLEDVLEREIRTVIGAAGKIPAPRTKLVIFPAPCDAGLRQLRVADDICVMAGDPWDVASVEDLRDLLSSRADLAPAIELIRGLREVSQTFSVTVTVARSPIGDARQILEVATGVIARRYGLIPCPPATRAALDFRLFVDQSYVVVGVRLFATPLTARPYRIVGTKGSLRPTVAAAMVILACPDGAPRKVWDPFCGSGTILAESFLRGHSVTGSDIDPDAVNAARENLATLRHDLWAQVLQGDATLPKTWKQHAGADTIITNLPWGKQIPIASRAALYSMVGQGIGARLSKGGRACVLTVEPERLVAQLRQVAPHAVIAIRTIGLLGQRPSLMTAAPPTGRPQP